MANAEMTPVCYFDLKTKKIGVKLSDINEISLFATVVIYENPIQSALWGKQCSKRWVSECDISDNRQLI